jgi:hypothetical protein
MLATAVSWSFAELETAIRACWDEQTCDPAVNWDPDDPAAGHCGVTSMALRDLLGGYSSYPRCSTRTGNLTASTTGTGYPLGWRSI